MGKIVITEFCFITWTCLLIFISMLGISWECFYVLVLDGLPTFKLNYISWKSIFPCLDKRVGTNSAWSLSKYSRLCSQHFVNVEPSLENPIPTMNLVYDIYEWRNLKMVFPESKNNAFILVARPFCNQKNMNIYSYHFAFILCGLF